MMDTNSDLEGTALATRFMAMANCHIFMLEEIAASAKQVRFRQAEAWARVMLLKDNAVITPLAISLIVSALARTRPLESNIGFIVGRSKDIDAMSNLVPITLTTAKTF